MPRPWTKLTPQKLADIQARLRIYEANTPKQLAREYGISSSYVYLIHVHMRQEQRDEPGLKRGNETFI